MTTEAPRSIAAALLAPVAMALLLLAACSKEPAPGAAPPAAPAAPADAAQAAQKEEPLAPQPNEDLLPALATTYTGDLDGMIERRVIRVLTTYSKTNYFVDRGTQRGLTYEAFKLFEDDVNKALENKHVRVNVVIIPTTAADLIPALTEGRGDIVAAGQLITETRKEQVDFSIPTRSHVSTIVVTGPGAPPIKTVEDLGGQEVYLPKSVATDKAVANFNAMLAKAGRPPVKIRFAPEELVQEDILEMVNAGLVPITLSNDYVAAFWQQVFTDIVVHTDVAVQSEGQVAMMVRKNNPKLLAEVNAYLKRYPDGSKERNVLFQKYLKNAGYAKNVRSKDEMKKFEQVVGLLKKYSDQYDLDYLLMTAQGYQESTLDPNKKSPVGAIGVMQVMPPTGKDMNVGDITQVEPNIHAGVRVRYVRFMMDSFYGKEPMDRINKGLFTFASYNAGPGRIRQLRARAAKRGLDPNKWFNNVELIAAEAIGRETVQYVSNIYKYYLAYTMLTEQREARVKAKQGVGGGASK